MIAAISNLAIVGFLFAPLLKYETKYYVGEEKVKEYFSANIIKLFDSSITRTWLAVVLLIFVGIIVISTFVSPFVRNNKKAHDVFVTINLITTAVLVAYILFYK